MQKKFLKNSFFVGILKVNDENRGIRIRIRIHYSEAWIRGSGAGFTPKYHGSETLILGMEIFADFDSRKAICILI
jgi:hypothetical protein